MARKLTRRSLLQGSAALAATGVFAAPIRASAPPTAAITPELVAAARKEGRVVWYTSVDLKLAQQIGKAFETRFPGVACRVERTGAERLFQRIGQEYASRIHAVDVVNSSDAAHLVVWKRNGWLAPYVPEDVAKYYPDEHKDADGMYASFRIFLSVMAYNPNLVKPEEAPRRFADLLDPKWRGKLVKAHPGYSGTIMTATFQMARDLGWEFFEKLAQQNVMQTQSATDPPKKLTLGERAVQVDGVEYLVLQLQEQGQPIAPIYAAEGSPLIIGPNAIFKGAPNPNAARLFQSWCFTAECQQLCIDVGGLRSAHPHTREKPDRVPFAQIRKMKDDAEGVERSAEEIKARYSRIFKV